MYINIYIYIYTHVYDKSIYIFICKIPGDIVHPPLQPQPPFVVCVTAVLSPPLCV